MSIDHTLSWEVARVGGMVAYVLATGSVVLGLLLSLGVRSSRWPRFITTELHRFISLLSLVFIGVHTLAVFVDPFTAFTPAEVLVPFTTHYRPAWIGIGIVSGYLAIAVWASEYVRPFVGYRAWRTFHYLSFAVFILGAVHGLGSGSDSREAWALAVYAVTLGAVAVLMAWRLARALQPGARDAAIAGLVAVLAGMAIFAVAGPAQAGWNEIANNGNGNGASAAWLASQPQPATLLPAGFSASLDEQQADEERITWTFASAQATGVLQLFVDDGRADLQLSLDNGWSCSGSVVQAGNDALASTCSDADGQAVAVRLEQLRREGSQIAGEVRVGPA
ncbi:MAG TPA: ferric reductase-like transmembrane domain-containing protein [Candidatus Limnocylindria bacterium]